MKQTYASDHRSAALDAAFATLGTAFAALLAHEATAQGRQTSLETALTTILAG